VSRSWLAALLGLAAVAALASAAPGAAPAQDAGQFLAGRLLVATEELRDPRFRRTVILMLRHDASGAMGLVVNRPLGAVPLAGLLRRFGMDAEGVTGEVRVHLGGPVEPTRGVVLHSAEYAAAGTEMIGDDIAVTSRPGILRDIAEGRGPRKSRFVAGYAGWAPGQLEGEIDNGAWFSVDGDARLVFDTDASRQWEEASARRRIHL